MSENKIVKKNIESPTSDLLNASDILTLKERYEDYIEMSEEIKENIDDIFNSYLQVGSLLVKINKDELFKLSEYNSIYEYANSEFGISETSVKNLMSIVLKFCDERGYLLKDYEGYTYSSLVELLSVKELDLKVYKPSMTVKEIRVQKVVDKINDSLKDFLNEEGFLNKWIDYIYSVDINKILKTTAFNLSHKINKDEYTGNDINLSIDFVLSNKLSKQKINFCLKYYSYKNSFCFDSDSGNYNGEYFYFSRSLVNSVEELENVFNEFLNKLKTEYIVSEENKTKAIKKDEKNFLSISDFYAKRLKDSYYNSLFSTLVLKVANEFLSDVFIDGYGSYELYKEKKPGKANKSIYSFKNTDDAFRFKIIKHDEDADIDFEFDVKELLEKELRTFFESIIKV